MIGDKFTIKTVDNAYSADFCIPWGFTLLNTGVQIGKARFIHLKKYIYFKLKVKSLKVDRSQNTYIFEDI